MGKGKLVLSLISIALIGAMSINLVGCTSNSTICEPPIISMDIELYPSAGNSVKHYTDPDKIDRIINCISALELSIFCGKVEEFIGEGYTVVATNGDGKVYTYTFVENRFFRMDDGEWMELDSEQAKELEQLIASLPSD